MTIHRNKNRELQKSRSRPDQFTDKMQKEFLSHFAATCNVKDAAAKVGVAASTLYRHRSKDVAFRDAWAEAQDNAIAVLRAELVRRGLDLLRAATPDEASLAAIQGMDAKFLLNLVQIHERNAGKLPGDIKPQRSDANEAAARLQALLIRMRLERKRELEERRQERLERKR